MAETVNYGWLKDSNNNKFAPKTLSSQIVTNEGKSFEDEIKQQISSASTNTNGIIVNITADGWNLQNDGTYKKIIEVIELTGKETLDMCLYPGDTHTQEQIIAYCEKITSVDIEEGKLILTASEALTVSFRVFLYGKIDIDEDSIVALGDNVLEVKTVTQEYYDDLPESEKSKGIYITDGDDLTAKNIYYDGSETGLGNTVHDAIGKLNSNIDEQSKNFEWKHYATSTSSTCNIPSDFNELMVRIMGTDQVFKWVLIKSDLEVNQTFIQGYNNSTKNYCYFKITSSGITDISITIHDSALTPTTDVYYR